MPELPEVQTIVNQLAEKLVGKTIEAVHVRLPKMFEGDKKDVVGAKIKSVERRAKIIIIKLDNGKNIVVHLKMTGQLVYGKGDRGNKGYVADTVSFSQGIPFAGMSLPGKTTHVIFTLRDSGRGQNDGESKLFFNDMRQFGWVRVINNDQLAMINEKHGPEPFDYAQGKPSKEFTPEYLLKICSNWGRPIKLLLMEQGKIAGIGNIYANEALWYSAISPMKRGRDLAKEEPEKVKELYDAIKKVLEMGIKYQGSSAADEAFVNALGEKGKMQDHFMVYQKQGQPCQRCGSIIVTSRIGGRGTFFCPKCQE